MRLIDADALKGVMIETLEIIKANPKMDNQEAHVIAAFHTVGIMIDDAPTVDAEQVRHGEWIFKERKGIKEAWYQCSECNAYDLREIDVTSHYCWACGAKMDGERKDK